MEKGQSVLCPKCQKFYGSEATRFHCSSCFRQLESANPVPAPAPEEVAVDRSRCNKCGRKVGLLGFDCRCGRTFCKLHRMSEEHDCGFDFGAEDRKRLK
jgi:predicted nucleic acid binding AN1-type Zn finger protein